MTLYTSFIRPPERTTINIGDVVLVHDDKPRIKWKLAVIENLTEGKDGHVRSTDIRTANGKTNRPIAKLYPLEVRAITTTEYPIENEQPVTPIENTRELQTERPFRMAGRNALQRIANWTKVLKATLEDVGN